MTETAELTRHYEDFWPTDKIRLHQTYIDDDGSVWLIFSQEASIFESVRSVKCAKTPEAIELHFRKGSVKNKRVEDGELAPELEEDWAEHHTRWMQSPERKKLYETIGELGNVYAVRLPAAPQKELKVLDYVIAPFEAPHGW